jgi:hypothetical protein
MLLIRVYVRAAPGSIHWGESRTAKAEDLLSALEPNSWAAERYGGVHFRSQQTGTADVQRCWVRELGGGSLLLIGSMGQISRLPGRCCLCWSPPWTHGGHMEAQPVGIHGESVAGLRDASKAQGGPVAAQDSSASVQGISVVREAESRWIHGEPGKVQADGVWVCALVARGPATEAPCDPPAPVEAPTKSLWEPLLIAGTRIRTEGATPVKPPHGVGLSSQVRRKPGGDGSAACALPRAGKGPSG